MAVDPNIKNKATKIRNEIYGKDVREALASGLEAMSEDVVDNKNRQDSVEGRFQDVIDGTTDKDVISAPEILDARQGHSNLGQNLLSMKQELAQTEQDLTAQLHHKVGGGRKAEPEDLSPKTLGLLTGTGGPISIESIPQDYSVTPKKLLTNYNPLSEVPFIAGRFGAGGAANPGDDRVISNGYFKIEEGTVIEVTDSRFSFNVYLYTSPKLADFVSAAPEWFKRYVFDSAYYVKIITKIDTTPATDVVNYVNQMSTILKIPGANEFITNSAMIANKIITENHLTNELMDILTQQEDRKSFDLVLLAGQSNAAGRGVASQAPVVPDGVGYEFRAISDPTKLYPILEPFGKSENKTTGIDDGTAKTGSLFSAFSNEYYAITGRAVVGVSASKGGSAIAEWQPGTPYLTDAINRLNTAKSWLTYNGYTVRNVFMLWCQGENDAHIAMPAEEYETKYKTMVEEVSNHVDHVFMIRIGNKGDFDPNYKTIIQAQTDLSKTYDKTTLVSTKAAEFATTGMLSDGLHFTQPGYNLIGKESAINTAFYVENHKEPVMYDPENDDLYYSQKL